MDAGAPPAPPQLVTFDEQTDQFRRVQAQIAIRITELEKIVAVCTTSRTQVCGLPKNEAPSPWLALNDVPCRGYKTKSTREYDFCGYW